MNGFGAKEQAWSTAWISCRSGMGRWPRSRASVASRAADRMLLEPRPEPWGRSDLAIANRIVAETDEVFPLRPDENAATGASQAEEMASLTGPQLFADDTGNDEDRTDE
jgi:hypothetical protein